MNWNVTKNYDFQSLRLIEEIDLKELLSSYGSEYEAISGGAIAEKRGHRNLLIKELRRIQSQEEIKQNLERVYADLLYDIDTGEVELEEVEEEAEQEINNDNIWMLVGTSKLKLNNSKMTQVRNSKILENTSYITVPTSALPEKMKSGTECFQAKRGVPGRRRLCPHIFNSTDKQPGGAFSDPGRI